MLQNYARSMVELPVPDHERTCTDRLCAIVGPLFFIAVLGMAIGFRHKEHIRRLDFSVDSDGRTCGNDLPDFPNLYYPDSSNFSKQLCVTKCPALGDEVVECSPTKTISCPHPDTIIDTERVDTQRGNYCLPKIESFRYRVISRAGLVIVRNERAAISIANACIPLALCFGLLYLIMVQFFPKCMVWTSLFLAGVSLLGLSVLVFLDWSVIWRTHRVMQIVLGIVLLFLGFTMISVVWVYRGQIALCDIFLKYAGIMLRYYSPLLFAMIPVFTIVTVLFMLLCNFQHNCFYNYYPPVLEPAGNYYISRPNYLLVALNAFAFFWGLNFIRDSFSYILTGNAVEWYFTHKNTDLLLPVKRLFLKNIGSVFGGSYLNTLFLIPSMLVDAVTCQHKAFRNINGEGCANQCCLSFLTFMNIARKDSYAYINLTGIQYCDAARECEQLCARSSLYPGSHSSILPFRAAFHMSSLLPVIIITVFYLMRVGSGGYFQMEPVLLVTFLSFCLLTYFIDMHADVAEGLEICYFVEYELYELNPNTNLWVGPGEMTSDIHGAELRYSRVGNISVI